VSSPLTHYTYIKEKKREELLLTGERRTLDGYQKKDRSKPLREMVIERKKKKVRFLLFFFFCNRRKRGKGGGEEITARKEVRLLPSPRSPEEESTISSSSKISLGKKREEGKSKEHPVP